MLSSRNSRHSSPGDSLLWQTFAKEEGRKSAEKFLERLRDFKANNEDTPESMCVREFATALTESLANHLDRCTSPSRSSIKPGKSKHWWNIFKRGKSLRRKSSRDVTSSYESTRQIILDRTVTQMNLQDGCNGGEWIRCRLVLVGFQDNYQIEVYCPPKTVIPKMSLFCFLIEEVRTTSTLEAPDSHSAFVIKSRSHGEYVFDAGTIMDKDLWIDIINQHTTSPSKPDRQLTGSLSLGAICDSNGSIRSNGRSGTKISRSRSQTPVHRATSPLVENYRVPTMSSNSQPEPPSSPFIRNSTERRRIGFDSSMPRRTSNDEHSPPTIPHHLQIHSESETSTHITLSTGNNSSSNISPNVMSVASIDSENSMSGILSLSSRKRKSSAPPTVTMSLNNRDDGMFNSNEALGRVGSEERLSFVNFPAVNGSSNSRCHSRQRSFDSSLNHTTDSTLASNRYTINIGSQEQFSNGASGPSSTFSSAGNLHDVRVTSPVSSTPERMMRYETASQTSNTNPLYIETTNSHQVNSYTDQSYNTWASTRADVQNLRLLSQYPWFHGMISRNIATNLVLSAGNSGSGQYLVRQSESREGDFVLTYNCHNRAKHLRLTIDQSGCNIQHLWFEDVLTMLEYFKTHPIPLDAMPAADDVMLQSYVNRSASDSFRTTTIINMDRIHRNPPRRHHSMHVSSTRSTDGSTLSQSSNSSSNQPSRQLVNNWRQIFSRQNNHHSSSSQSVRGGHVTVQRTQSANAGSLQEIRRRSTNQPPPNKENSYVWKMY